MRLDPRLASSVRRSRKAAVAPLARGIGDVLGVGGEDGGGLGADRRAPWPRAPVLLPPAGASASTRAAARARAELGHRRLKVGVAVDGFEGGGHGSFNLLLAVS